MSTEDERFAFSRASAAAVDVAVREVRVHLPESSEARALLLIIGNAVISAARLGVDRADVLALVEGALAQGARMPRETSLFP